jgi:protein gp37
MSKTTIEWTATYNRDGTIASQGESWNWVTGCDPISPGCDHCYAQTFAERFRGTPGHPYEQGFDLRLWPARLDLPRTWKKPRRVFVNSMSDWTHEGIPDEFILEAFKTMLEVPRHTYQLLTKRAPRMVRLVPKITKLVNEITGSPIWPAHIWLGVTCESAAQRGRIAHLRKVPCRVHFVSYEPALGPLTDVDLSGIQWLIAGSESGRGARPMDEDWVRDARDMCIRQGCAFFYKQKTVNGHKVPLPELDGQVWNQFPDAA